MRARARAFRKGVAAARAGAPGLSFCQPPPPPPPPAAQACEKFDVWDDELWFSAEGQPPAKQDNRHPAVASAVPPRPPSDDALPVTDVPDGIPAEELTQMDPELLDWITEEDFEGGEIDVNEEDVEEAAEYLMDNADELLRIFIRWMDTEILVAASEMSGSSQELSAYELLIGGLMPWFSLGACAVSAVPAAPAVSCVNSHGPPRPLHDTASVSSACIRNDAGTRHSALQECNQDLGPTASTYVRRPADVSAIRTREMDAIQSMGCPTACTKVSTSNVTNDIRITASKCVAGTYAYNTRPSALGSMQTASRKSQWGTRSRYRDRYALPTRLRLRQSVLSMLESELDDFIDTTQLCQVSRCLWYHGYVDEFNCLLLPGAFPSS